MCAPTRTTNRQVVSGVVTTTPGMSFPKVTGLATDGASAMTGCRQGAATRLKEENPAMIHTHCGAHRENLAVAAACEAVVLAVEVDSLLVEVRVEDFEYYYICT